MLYLMFIEMSNTHLKMETFHLLHLAACWTGRTVTSRLTSSGIPLTTGPVSPVISQTPNPTQLSAPAPPSLPNTIIRAAAVQMVFASRKSRDFITPREVEELERWTGQVSSRSPSSTPLCSHVVAVRLLLCRGF